MKYQVFLINDKKQACSFILQAKNEKDAGDKAMKKAKSRYGIDFKVWKIFNEGC